MMDHLRAVSADSSAHSFGEFTIDKAVDSILLYSRSHAV